MIKHLIQHHKGKMIISGAFLAISLGLIYCAQGISQATIDDNTVFSTLHKLLSGEKLSLSDEAVYHLPETTGSLQPFDTQGQLLEQDMLGLGGMTAQNQISPHMIYPDNTLGNKEEAAPTLDIASSEEELFGEANSDHPLPLVRQATTLKMPESE